MGQQFPFDRFFKGGNSLNTQETPTIKKESSFEESSPAFSSSELATINQGILEQLSTNVPLPKFSAYFESNLNLCKIDSKTIIFNTSTLFIKNIIESHYLSQLSESIVNVLGKEYQVEITINKSPLRQGSVQNSIENSPSNEALSGKSDRKNAKDVKFTLDLSPTQEDAKDVADSRYLNHVSGINTILIDPEKNFDNFIIGPSNNMAYATALAVAKNPGKSGKYPSLYFYSNSGLGKTHLLHAVANGIKENHPTLTICIITARDFMKEMIQAMQNNKMSDFQHRYSHLIDVLMIDDIHELKDKKGTQNEFFHVFNALYNKGKQLIFTSDKAPKEIDGIEERIKTRLQWGLVVDIQKPDFETRIAILKRKAETIDLYLPDEIINLLACTIKSSIRELEGSLIKLSAFSEVMNTDVDLEMVKQLLNLENFSEKEPISLDTIAKSCSNHFKIPLADLKSKARNKEIIKARHVAMYLSQQIVGATLIQIGNYYGGRDHTSVLHAIKKVKELLKSNDSSLSKDLIVIENSI